MELHRPSFDLRSCAGGCGRSPTGLIVGDSLKLGHERPFDGETPKDTIVRLLVYFTASYFDTDQMVSVDDTSTDGRLEVLIPVAAHRRQIPVPSVN